MIRLNNYIDYVEAEKKSIHNMILFDALFNNTPYMAWFKDQESRYIKVNNDFKEHCGKGFEEIYGKDDAWVWDGKIGERCRAYDLIVMNERKQVVFDEMTPGRKENRQFNIHKAPVFDAYNEVIGTIGVARDITEQKKAQEHIEKLAYTDYLTNLANRRGLYKYIKEEIHKRCLDMTMMFVALDNFKQLNDSYGHYYGDQALQTIAKKLERVCKGAYVSRVGGDEFVIVYEGIVEDKWLRAEIEQIVNDIKTEFRQGDTGHIVSASIGVVMGNTHETSIETLLYRGDLVLYKAKEKGKNQYVMYTKALEEN